MRVLAMTGALILAIGTAAAQQQGPAQFSREWYQQFSGAYSDPIEPFRIVGNIHYVGAANIASYLIATPQGHILIDTGMNEMHDGITRSIEKLGFKLADIKIMLSSHAHFDHVEGHAEMQRLSGATVMAVGEDAAALSAGQDNSALGGPGWNPVKVGRILRDGDTVTLGGTTLTAHLTAGHTKGCTTWMTTVADGGKSLRVVFVGGTSVNQGVQLLDNARHPSIVADYDRTFKVLKELQADIFLAQHPNMFQMEGKVARMNAGKGNPFVDPEGYRAFVAASEESYRAQLQRERAGRAQRQP